MEGFQCWLEFNHDQMHAVGVQPGRFHSKENQINWMFADNGLLPISWNSEQKKHVETGEILFIFLQIVVNQYSCKMAFNEGRIHQIYHSFSETKNLVLESRERYCTKQVVFKQLLQIPFTDQATVEIDSPLDAELQMKSSVWKVKFWLLKWGSVRKDIIIESRKKWLVNQACTI